MPRAPIIERLWLAGPLRDDLLAHASRVYPDEVGGILTGYQNGVDAVVAVLIGPGAASTSTPMSFTPDGPYHAAEMARVYAESEGRFGYLGDWHTHPNGVAGLSALDVRTLRAIARARSARCENPLMLVAAGSPESWTLAGFTLGPKRWLTRRTPMAVTLRVFDPPR